MLIIYSHRYIKIKQDVFILFFVFITSLSAFFSLDIQTSFVRIMTLSTTFVFLFYVVSFDKVDLEKFLYCLFFLSSVYIFFSYLNVDSLKDYKGEFEGYVGNRYNISILLSIYFILPFSLALKVRSFYFSLLFLIVSLLNFDLIFLSHSRVGFFNIFIYVMALVGVFMYRLGFINKILVFFGLFLIFGILSYTLKSNEYVLYAIERGMTGRDELASVLINYMCSNPYSFILGFGAGSLESLAPSILYNISPRDVNNIVGVLFEYGVLGLIVFLALFLRYFYQLYKLCKIKNINYPYLCIPVPIIFSISEVSWLNFNTFPTIVMYLFIAYTSYIYTKEKYKFVK